MKHKPNFFKKNERPDFQSMLLRQCEITSKSISLLLNYLAEPEDYLAEQIESCEKKADKVRQHPHRLRRKLIYYAAGQTRPFRRIPLYR